LSRYESITIILEDVEILLDGILLSGINVIGESTINELNNLAVKYRDIGLKEGSEMLLRLSANLSKKRHSLNFDSAEIVRDIMVLGTYVSVIKGRIKNLKIEESSQRQVT
jgi:hypothetical protein